MMAWMEDLNGATSESYERASSRMKEMGTNALPGLMGMLTSEASSGEGMAMAFQDAGLPMLHIETALDRQWQALKGFEVLGSNALPVFDSLVGLLNGGQHADVVPFALAEMGEPALEPLQSAMSHRNEAVRWNSALAVSTFGKDGASGVGALLNLLEDANARVRCAAASALGILGKNDDEVVAALSESLMDQDSTVRSAATKSLELLLRR